MAFDKTKSHTRKLLTAIENGDFDAARLAIDNGADVNYADEEMMSPLMHAARNCQPEIVDLLIERGANVNEVDDMIYTAMHYACGKHTDLELDAARIVKSLLVAGAKMDFRNASNNTAAERAVMNDNLPALRHLMDHGYDPTLTSDSGDCALTLSLMSGRRPEIFSLLADRSSTLEPQSLKHSQKTSSLLAIALFNERLDAVEYLLDPERGLNRLSKDKHPVFSDLSRLPGVSTKEVIDMAIRVRQAGFDFELSPEDTRYRRAIHQMLSKPGYLPMLSALHQDRPLDIETPDQWGRTPLYSAYLQQCAEGVHWLIERGCDVNTPGTRQMTVLGEIAENRFKDALGEVKGCYFQMAKTLISSGARLDEKVTLRKGGRPQPVSEALMSIRVPEAFQSSLQEVQTILKSRLARESLMNLIRKPAP